MQVGNRYTWNGTPLQHSCLENPMDGEAWKAAVHGVAEGYKQQKESRQCLQHFGNLLLLFIWFSRSISYVVLQKVIMWLSFLPLQSFQGNLGCFNILFKILPAFIPA